MQFNGKYSRVIEGIIKLAGTGIAPGDKKVSMIVALVETKEEFHMPGLSFRLDAGERVKIYTCEDAPSEGHWTLATAIEVLNSRSRSKAVKFIAALEFPDLFR